MANSPLLNNAQQLGQGSDLDGTSSNIPEKLQHNSHQSGRPNVYRRWVENWWLGELVAVLSSCAVVVALCIILKKYDGQPVPSFGTWFNSGITLGTLVSLLTTLAVAMALSTVQECLSQLKWLWYSGASRPLADVEVYDRASRGLMGSVQLLWNLRFITANFGALLTIAHLAIAPLAQQSLRSLSVQVATFDGDATIPISKYWSEPSQQLQTLKMPDTYTSISPGMKGAIFNGLFAGANVTINNTLPTCTTGNCTFPSYRSLAVCASSADVTPHLQNLSSEDVVRWCLPGGFCAFKNNTGSGFSYLRANVTSAVTRAYKDAASSMGHQSFNYTSLAFANHPSPISDFYIIYKNKTASLMSASHPLRENSWAAVEFVLDWCVPTFSTQVTNGTAVTLRGPDPFMDFKGTEPGYYLTGHVGDEEIKVDPSTHYTLQRYLNLTLSGAAYAFEADHWADSDQVQKLVSLFGIAGTQGEGADWFPTRAESLAALDAMLVNTATSITNYVRSHSTFEETSISGKAYVQQNVVRVDWPWIAAPIVFSAGSLLFFIVVAALCSFRGTVKPPLWKSSALATMRCLDPTLYHDLDGSPGEMALSDAAKRQRVRLVRDGEGWLLVEGTSTKSNTGIRTP